jgi:hypothetical protein
VRSKLGNNTTTAERGTTTVIQAAAWNFEKIAHFLPYNHHGHNHADCSKYRKWAAKAQNEAPERKK